MPALLALLLASPGVSIEVDPGLACVTREGLAHRLEAAGEPLAALQVSIHRSPGGIVVEGARSDGRRLSREVPLDDCASVELAVTLLVQSWAHEKQLPGLAPTVDADGPEVLDAGVRPAPATRPLSKPRSMVSSPASRLEPDAGVSAAAAEPPAAMADAGASIVLAAPAPEPEKSGPSLQVIAAAASTAARPR